MILTGMSCSGKDTIRKEIIDKWGFNNMVTYTTRPMRNGEINGKDYIFINEKEFMDKVDNGDIIEYRKYKVYSGDIWYYGSRERCRFRQSIICLRMWPAMSCRCGWYVRR